MAVLHAQQGEVDQALDLYQQSLDIKERIGDARGKAATLAMLGQLLADERQEYATAVRYLQRSLALLGRLRSPDAATVERMIERVLWRALAEHLQAQGEEAVEERLAALTEDETRALLAAAGLLAALEEEEEG